MNDCIKILIHYLIIIIITGLIRETVSSNCCATADRLRTDTCPEASCPVGIDMYVGRPRRLTRHCPVLPGTTRYYPVLLRTTRYYLEFYPVRQLTRHFGLLGYNSIKIIML